MGDFTHQNFYLLYNFRIFGGVSRTVGQHHSVKAAVQNLLC